MIAVYAKLFIYICSMVSESIRCTCNYKHVANLFWFYCTSLESSDITELCLKCIISFDFKNITI